MAAVLLKSRLNPFATTFIPSIRQNLIVDENSLLPIIRKGEIKPSEKSDMDGKLRDCETSEVNLKHWDMYLVAGVAHSKTSLWNEAFIGGFNNLLSACKNASGKTLAEYACESEKSKLQVLQDSPVDSKKGCVGNLYSTERLDALKRTNSEECRCPSVFGWVIPLDFFGNPFNLKSSCNKNYAHISLEGKKEVDGLNFDAKINELTLDQCLLEIKDILTDVYEAICFDPDSICKTEDKTKDLLDVSEMRQDKDECDKLKHSSWILSTSEVSETELIDDGCHPLLQSGIPVEDDDDDKELEKAQKILGKSLTPSTKARSLECLVSGSRSVCDPPCSVWCEFLPSAAKDTFRKFIHSSTRVKGTRVVDHEEVSFGRRPIYRRSFSANDAQMYAQPRRGLCQSSTTESREMLMLLRKDPVAYFKNFTSDSLKGGTKHGSSCPDLLDYNSRSSFNAEGSGMWGQFDGANSLWQPLPDCVPTNDQNQKQNCHRRVREMRRQRSIN